jgi:putative membrane protein
MEVELGRLAAKKGRSVSVKQFGRRMVTDHTHAGNQLKKLAARKGIGLPGEMDTEGKEAMERLLILNGAEFDRAYMEMMVTDHEKDVGEFRKRGDLGRRQRR